ncbi:MAG: GNAT family N-acetyltransferase [Rhodobacteraceae bacterium]|nr:GNAT family N-acetyltransferase [Paracoccaceae bacterium]
MLKLRPFRDDDFEAFHAIVSDYEVVKMLGSWPFPAEAEFTRMRMNTLEAKAGQVLVIEVDGEFAGTIGGMSRGIGYMLGRAFWGRGVGTWAVREMVRRMFEGSDISEVTASAWQDNAASARVLEKCGFRTTGVGEFYGKARGETLEFDDFSLSRADWARAQPVDLDTDRLKISALTCADANDLSRILSDPNVAWMMGSITNPFTPKDAERWIAERTQPNMIGCFAKVSLNDGTIIGFVRLSVGRLSKHKSDFSIGYAIGKTFGGHGYATEVLRAFLEKYTRIYALKNVSAGVMNDNPASIRVLEKLGFMKTGERMHLVNGRREKAPLWLYTLTR